MGRALLSSVSRHAQAWLPGVWLALLSSVALAAQATPGTVTPEPPAPGTQGQPSAEAPEPQPALPTPAEQLEEVIVQTTEPRYVAPTNRDRIGRIWAPVLIDGKGPYRMVLDTGATRSAITVRAAQSLGNPKEAPTLVTGFTGQAVVPTIHVSSMEFGELAIGPTELPVLMDVFGGAQGVLGIEGLGNKRIVADFTRDRIEIVRSHGERAHRDFKVVPLREVRGLLIADVRLRNIHCKAIIDTGAQGTIGNLALRQALMRHPPSDAKHADITGVTLDVQSGDDIRAPDIDFGDLTVHGAHIVFGDMYLFHRWHLAEQPALSLGMDLLGSFDVLIIDYNRHELQIRPRDGPGTQFRY